MASGVQFVVLIFLLTFTVSSGIEKTKKFVVLKVMGEDNSEVHFKIACTTQLKKLKQAYCDRLGIPMSQFRFLYNGQRIDNRKTPNMLGMEDGDVIEVYREQSGSVRQIDDEVW